MAKRHGVLLRIGVVALACAVAPPAVLADHCYGQNDGVGVVYRGTYVATGARADVDLVPANPAPGSAIFHPFQMIGSYMDGDFVGWGTYRGEGTDIYGGLSQCPTYTGAGWRVYADGIQFGRPWCRANYGTLSQSASNQQFKAVYATCSDGTTRWVLYLNGEEMTCARISSSTAIVAVGGESAYVLPPYQVIDVDYENLQVRFNSGWAYWGPSIEPCTPGDPRYHYLKVSNTEYLMRS